MTDKQLETKFSDLADGIIPAATIRRVMDACWNVESSAERGRDRKDVGVILNGVASRRLTPPGVGGSRPDEKFTPDCPKGCATRGPSFFSCRRGMAPFSAIKWVTHIHPT